MKDLSLKENKHNYDYFPCGVYQGADCLLHWHDEIELIRSIKNNAKILYNGNEIILNKDEFIFLPPESVHSIRCEENAFFDAIVFKSSILFDNYYTVPIPTDVIVSKRNANIDSMFDNIIKLFFEKSEFYLLEIKSDLLILLKEILVSAKKQNITSVNYDPITSQVKTIIEYIHNNYMNKISINDLAELSNFSKYYFIRLFKQYTMQTPVNYINNYRLSVAKDMILQNNESISEISYKVGFDSVSYFIKKFKQTYGCTPNEYYKSKS